MQEYGWLLPIYFGMKTGRCLEPGLCRQECLTSLNHYTPELPHSGEAPASLCEENGGKTTYSPDHVFVLLPAETTAAVPVCSLTD